MEYTIVSRVASHTLVEVVTRLIAEGWEPLGGVAVVGGYGTQQFYQALIKKDVTLAQSQNISIRTFPPSHEQT